MNYSQCRIIFGQTQQIGRLYIVIAIGHPRIFVLPKGEKAIESGNRHNPPRNKGAVEVYGAISGVNTRNAVYGWIHKGEWVKDFDAIFEEKKALLKKDALLCKEINIRSDIEEKNRVKNLLESYSKHKAVAE